MRFSDRLRWIRDLLGEQCWQWRHRRCVPILQTRRELRPANAAMLVCAKCLLRLLDEEIRPFDVMLQRAAEDDDRDDWD